ncbi:MAG: ABC transporter ATP-binding protein [Pseudomonadota bacterium]
MYDTHLANNKTDQSVSIQPGGPAAQLDRAGPPTLMTARKLCKTYHAGSAPVRAVDGIELEIEAGSFTVLMGCSGSGKSTLLYLLSGLEQVSSGEVWFGAQRVDLLDETGLALLRRRSMGFVFQAVHLVPDLTLLENLVVVGALLERDRRQLQARARALLERVGIGELADRRPAEISGGEQQRAAIARSLINCPEVLFADEPTGSLNSRAGLQVLDLLGELHAAGQTVVMATHDVAAACRGDRLLLMRDGRVVGERRLDREAGGQVDGQASELFGWLKQRGW